MAELTPLPPAQATTDTGEYQPVSSLAVASIAVAGLFAIILLVLMAIAFSTRKPVTSNELWMLALIGFGLSVAARIAIRRSEGTRTGFGLTTIAWWVCVMGGAGYAAYLFGSTFTLQKQSQRFAEEWFDHLRKGKSEAAFVLTLDPARRATVNPDNRAQVEAEFGQAIAAFRSNELVRLFQRSGDDAIVESLGMRGWEYQAPGYRVAYAWRLSSPEGEGKFAIMLIGTDGKDGVGRQWHVTFGSESNMGDLKRTSYGRIVFELMQGGQRFVQKWIEMRHGPFQTPAFVLILPEVKRNVLEALGLFGSGAIAVVPPEVLGFAPPATGFFTYQGSPNLTPERAEAFRKIWKDGIVPRGAFAGPAEMPLVRVTEKEVRVTVAVDVRLPSAGGAMAPGYVHLIAGNPEFIAKVWQLRQEGKNNPAQADLKSGEISEALPPAHWQIVGLDSSLEAHPGPTGPGAPGGPGMPRGPGH